MSTDERPPPYDPLNPPEWLFKFSYSGSSWFEPLLSPLRVAFRTVCEVRPQMRHENPLRYCADREIQRLAGESMNGRLPDKDLWRIRRELIAGNYEQLRRPVALPPQDPPAND